MRTTDVSYAATLPRANAHNVVPFPIAAKVCFAQFPERICSLFSYCVSILIECQSFVECQRADWPNHKPSCRSLQGGRWVNIRFWNTAPGREGMWEYRITKHDQATALFEKQAPSHRSSTNDEPSVNTHGEQPFILKMQYVAPPTPDDPDKPMFSLAMESDSPGGPKGPSEPQFTIFDRLITFRGVVMAMNQSDVFDELVREMRGPRALPGRFKMYRWAKRISDWELSILLDRLPAAAQDIKW